ncbi:uncharacterized protein B0P05DRAFT_513835 [Gilbertella persicaria]|uniref:uncharacterized protein n=1 Tax=Gilbertella persicaria TaxID=101096 RepID=UPI0022205D02|nr:uncharacterized protein B0P05DRAFT_513835 [Gilbertella persicaria]KAI8070641.1 hypothetical protein B0P05DRAFT_513835 [Gilbertella persicaria]
MHRLFKNDLEKRITFNESNYSFHVLWPLVEFAVDSLNKENLSFICGEHILVSSKEEYKADGVVVLQDNIEICLLEISGKYKLNDIPHTIYDHVKGCFGVLCMLNNLIKKYHKATIETAITLKVPFVHARGDAIHLWSLEICDNKLYALQKLYEAKIPLSWLDKAEVLSLGILLWLLRGLLSTLISTIDTMQEEHDRARTVSLLGLPSPGKDLLDFVNTDIKKPLKGASYGVLLPQDDRCEASTCMNNTL